MSAENVFHVLSLEQAFVRPLLLEELQDETQPCGTPFTTTGVGRTAVAKECHATGREFAGAYQTALATARATAFFICALNPNCPQAKFVRIVNVKNDCKGTELTVELTAEWQCVEGEKKEKPGKERPEKKQPERTRA